MWDDLAFIALFVATISVNKYVLSELKFTEPTVFQGWQTLVCIVLLSILIKFDKIKNEFQLLEKKTVYILVPALCGFTLSIVAGSIALASLPVPIFVAYTNLIPALLILIEDHTNGSVNSSLKVCSSVAVCGSLLTLSVLIWPRWQRVTYYWLATHIIFTILPIIYLHRVRFNYINPITKIYYNNFFSVAVLVPVSIYLDVLHLPRPFVFTHNNVIFYTGCLLSGIFGTFLQLSTSKVFSKDSFFAAQGTAKILATICAYFMFWFNIEPIEWVIVMFNLILGTIGLGSDIRDWRLMWRLKKGTPVTDEVVHL